MISLLAKVKISRFWPKTMDYSPWFFFPSLKNVLGKICHLKGGKKRNLMTLVLVA